MERRGAAASLASCVQGSGNGRPEKRQELAFAAQKLHWDDGGYIIPYFKQTIDGANKKVHGITPHVFPALSWYRFWNFWIS